MTNIKTVNYLSESAFGFEGNGVHTAFLNTLSMMKAFPKFKIKTNSFGPYSILHAHTFGPLYWIMKWLHKGKRVIHAHAIPETLVGQVLGSSLWLPLFTRYLVAYFNSGDSVICMTEQLKAHLIAMGVTRPIAVVSLPMNLAEFHPSPRLRASGRKRLGLSATERVVLCVGQIIPRKGFFDFMKVAAKNPGLEFFWIGEIPFSVASESYFKVKELVQSAPANVRFPGAFKLHEMPELYNAADLFFFPSLQETFGLSIAEAAACGLPMVLRDLDTYQESFGGHYLSDNNADGFSRCIRKFFASPSLRRAYARRSEKAVKRYETSSVGKDLSQLYNKILEVQL